MMSPGREAGHEIFASRSLNMIVLGTDNPFVSSGTPEAVSPGDPDEPVRLREVQGRGIGGVDGDHPDPFVSSGT